MCVDRRGKRDLEYGLIYMHIYVYYIYILYINIYDTICIYSNV